VAEFRPAPDPARITGIVSGLVVVPAIIVGLWARNSAKSWSLFRLIALYVLFLVIIAALFISGSMRGLPRANKLGQRWENERSGIVYRRRLRERR
jgi:hypothetical protein